MGYEYEDIILDPLPPQDRSTPFGRAALSLATFAGRALNATGGLLLALAGGANAGVTLLALLLNRASPGRGIPFFILVGISWVCWLVLAFLRWRINAAGTGDTVGQTWGTVRDDDYPRSRDSDDRRSGNQSGRTFQQSAAGVPPPPGAGDRNQSDEGSNTASPLSPRTRADGTVSVEALERARRAATEFAIRRKTPFPRVEAAQRSIRALVDGEYQPGWIRYDLRPLVVSFAAVATSIPIMMILGIISLIALLGSTAPF